MKTYSQKGTLVDFNQLIETQGATIAVGGIMNARGDMIGRGGAVIKTRDEVANDYYNASPKAVSAFVAMSDLESEVLSPADAVTAAIEQNTAIEPAVVAEVASLKRKRQSAESEE